MKERLSVPGTGRTVATHAEERATHVRRAVSFLEPELRSGAAEADFRRLFDPRRDSGIAGSSAEPSSLRAAWALVNVWLLGQLSRSIDPSATLSDAEDWFAGSSRPDLPILTAHVSPDLASFAIRSLSRISFDDDLLELLPYVLELHGPGTRLSVMRNPSTQTARDAKRKMGVYYTPADVAEYMVREVLSEVHSPGDIRYLDPSCGTGVYLVALLKIASEFPKREEPLDRLRFASRCLYGIDISTLAIESSAFVLLHHCMDNVTEQSLDPWAAWQALRLNLAPIDAVALRCSGDEASYAEAAVQRRAVRDRLLAPSSGGIEPRCEDLTGALSDGSLFGYVKGEPVTRPLGSVFPEVADGFEVVVGNPPYAAFAHRGGQGWAGGPSVRSLGETTGARNLYPLFIEMMWTLTKPGKNIASLVVPLSIAYHQGSQYRSCREAMLTHGGRWRCAFFDREPHALFGEEVKTRNAILFRRELGDDPPRRSIASFETGPLRRWTSRTRNQLFTSVTFTSLRRLNAAEGFPKLCGPEQANAFSTLSARPARFRLLCHKCRLCPPMEASLPTELPRVFVASTAYNFLNVYRSLNLGACQPSYPLSENTVHSLEFAREETAEIAFAILGSRVTFWLWHVLGDGFHVASSFIQNLPFDRTSFTDAQAESLRDAGRALWISLQDQRISSINRGKLTIAYRPLGCEGERDVIDSVLLDAAGLPRTFGAVLREFVKDTVVVDFADRRRNHLKSLFDAQCAFGKLA